MAGIIVLVILLSLIYMPIKIFRLKKEHKKLQDQHGELSSRFTELESKNYEFKDKVKSLSRDCAELEERCQKLERFQVVVDADEEAQRIQGLAQKTLAEAESNARALRLEVESETQETKKEIREMKRVASEQVLDELNAAQGRAQKILQEAEEKAKVIAADAYDAKGNANKYEEIAKAMRNTIEGYGNRYLIPTYTLLDELADDYGYTQAGNEMKVLRKQIKDTVREEKAAECDYVEDYRKKTAINFVTDAFNGKVDSILTRVKSDNYGQLKQKILDAFALVNHNGTAFRNARITNDYLNMRLDELKLGCILQGMKDREIEEQRRIKEQIREEEKARREIERALREAAKEEEIVQKAMEKIRAKFESASETQKTQYEAQLAELEEKLREAEEKNQRALSMAQQTRSGHVYIISNIGSFGENIYKIGMTRRLEPIDRVRELGDASVPFPFDVHAMIWSDDAPTLESELHRRFALNQVNKVNFRKEFFAAPLQEIREEVEKANLEVKWTMLAEAREYRETLAIEENLAENPEMKEAWLNRQLVTVEEEPVLVGAEEE